MARVVRPYYTFVAEQPVLPLTRQNLDKHEPDNDGDTDASSLSVVDAVVSEVSSDMAEIEHDRTADCGYQTDDDMYHPVYYMSIPPQMTCGSFPQMAPGTFIPALPTIPQSPMAASTPVMRRFQQPETPVSARRQVYSNDAFIMRSRSVTLESEPQEDQQKDQQEVQRKRASKKQNASSLCGNAQIKPSNGPEVALQQLQQPTVADRRVEPELDESERTTVMLKNLPKGLSRSMLLDLLEQKGFANQCNFVYLPVEFTRRSCMGYAFVNFERPSMVLDFWSAFEGLTDWPAPSSKICKVTWSSPLQGLSEHVERFRNSPLMHNTVPDECRPILLRSGVRMTFPSPTKTLRAPRPRASRSMRPFWQGDAGDADVEA